MTAFPNPFQENARLLKADRLTIAIERYCAGAGLDVFKDAIHIAVMLDGWPAAYWTELAIECGQLPPSPVTRAMIVSRFRARAAAGFDEDPFARVIDTTGEAL